ncbi:hypothetical protein ABTX85_34615 [Streptomyces sp. NPDC096097]|uniref:hypothetical protein n=1 Tax=Streptomyces sp. NPDC096097 TaxID=3155546 RepID=UPI003316B48C
MRGSRRPCPERNPRHEHHHPRKALSVTALLLRAALLPAGQAQAAGTVQPTGRTPGLYCLANTWNTATVSVKPCNPNDQGQYRNVTGRRISLAFAPAYCFANTWNTPNLATKPCDGADRGQNWAIFNDQISLALA